jgi:anti-anti-sigma factor
LKGILVAVIVSMAALAHQVYNPPVYRLARKRGTHVFRPVSAKHPDDETWPGLLILKTEGRIFFVNAERVGEQILQQIDEARPRVVVLNCSAVFDIEYTALKMLSEGEKKLQQRGITLWLAGLNPAVLAMVRHSQLGATLGDARMFFNVESAVERYIKMADEPDFVKGDK